MQVGTEYWSLRGHFKAVLQCTSCKAGATIAAELLLIAAMLVALHSKQKHARAISEH